MPLAPALEGQQVDGGQQLPRHVERARGRVLRARPEGVVRHAAEEGGGGGAQREAGDQRLREERVGLGEVVHHREQLGHCSLLALETRLVQPEHERARRGQQLVAVPVALPHLAEARAVQRHVPPHAQVDEEQVRAAALHRVAAQVAGLVLPEGVPDQG